MPESVRDRPSTAHEKIWLLTKQGAGYFYDYEATALPASDAPEVAVNGAEHRARVRRGDAKMAAVPGRTTHSLHREGRHEWEGLTRRLRNYEAPVEVDVWEMGAAGFPGAHFAVFPAALVERALAAGCPPGGRVLDPFAGSGTTGLVAIRTGRSAVLCEMNPEYAALARERVESGGKLDEDLRRQARGAARRAEQEGLGQGCLL